MIYFIRAEMAVKIGFVANRDSLPDRLANLQVGCPSMLAILGVTEGSRQREQDLHSQFSEDRFRGEWFHLSPRIIDFIETQCRPFVTELDRFNAILLSKGRPSAGSTPRPTLTIRPTAGAQLLEFVRACAPSDDVVSAKVVYECMERWWKATGQECDTPSARRLSFSLLDAGIKRFLDRNKCAFYGVSLPNIVCDQTIADLASA